LIFMAEICHYFIVGLFLNLTYRLLSVKICRTSHNRIWTEFYLDVITAGPGGIIVENDPNNYLNGVVWNTDPRRHADLHGCGAIIVAVITVCPARVESGAG
jgi:hypothetical protein